MRTDPTDRLEVGRDALPLSSLEALIDRIAAVALPLTAARGCLIDLTDGGTGARRLRMSVPSSGPLVATLEALAAARPGRARWVDRAVDGQGHRFLVRRLGGAGTGHASGSGTIVLGYLADGGDSGQAIADAEARAAPFVALLEELLGAHRAGRAMGQEVAALGQQVAALRRQVRRDALTGLENAAAFDESARAALEAGHASRALVLLDADHFKQINDLHGHQFGNVYLRAIAGVLRGSLPDGVPLGRIGGDEFAFLLPLASGEPPERQLQRQLGLCRAALARLAVTMGKPDLGAVSMGAAFFPHHGESYEALFEMADTALYAAKGAGRAAEVIYDPQRHLRFSLRALMRNFSGALAEGEIRPVFQPVVDLVDGRCTGFEVLARWQGAAGELIGPERFHPIFEKAVLAEQLTRSMILQATEVLSALPDRRADTAAPLRIGINVTGFDLHNPGFADELAARLAQTGLPWAAMVIEVPETVMLGETGGRIFEALRDLRSRGAKIALDDFGTGYGSLRHLGDWPIDMLKIDRQFVQGLSAHPRDRAVVEAILGMARRFGFRVVAEGIETPGQLSYLRAMGCEAGQGHLLSPPINAEALADAPRIYPICGPRAPEG